ncbi:hypothetical protein COCSUDRAFT_68051 [Coccomyxa subellipsoidea C-169]|uniref:Uncharacterized protein n=1 Tax=Coccomyxa subellipsoidea (strain C-169) TaxID=574566 RepID=I0YKD1_COCSC|nr:hypothetical protein COCSUDRAFT_68051 [Coccomyxa subellipsoidea C-169]EIE18850.1 hypothetical protein COCSUDRAFT_68051 [Coccomyxa subellipsoidea C-169]|eukprot:XP_005643394.1 hypothetical protein COCSUDRAFT_68051 [Coccomyxa subellipsoidea C-169]
MHTLFCQPPASSFSCAYSQRICSTSGRTLCPQKLSRGRLNHLVARASEQFETGLDAPALTDYLDGQMSQLQRTFAELEREMDADMSRVNERARQLQERGQARMYTERQNGAQTYRNEQQWEEQLPGGWRKGYRSESITYFGSPPAAAPQLQSTGLTGLGGNVALLAVATVVGAYAAVAAALLRSYKHTRYSASKAWLVVAVWPVLALFSDRFRQEIATALHQQGDGSNDDSFVS